MKRDLAIRAIDMALLYADLLKTAFTILTVAANTVRMNIKRGCVSTALKYQCQAKVIVTITLRWKHSLRQSKLN